MRASLILSAALILVCVAAIPGQTVNESASSVKVNDRWFEVQLAFDQKFNEERNATVQLLDLKNNMLASASAQIKKGAASQRLQLALSDQKVFSDADLAWFRLKYTVGNSTGFIGLAQILQGFHEIKVVSSGDIYPGMKYRVGVLARHPLTKRPIANLSLTSLIEIALKASDLDDLELRSSAVTDANGFAELNFNIPLDANIVDSDLEIASTKDGFKKTLYIDLDTIGDGLQFLTLTDKPIYQPEQTLNFRGVLMKGIDAKTVVAGHVLDIKIRDHDETILFSEKVSTSDFGVAAISWQIPETAKLGTYQITVKDENNDEISEESVRVSRYDLPNFVVKAKSMKSYYLTTEKTAEIEVAADYLFGKPVEKGKVRVVQETDRRWNYEEQKYDIEEGEVKEGETTDGGKFKATLDLADEIKTLIEKKYEKYQDLNFTAYFTDLTTNKTEQRHFDIRITKEELHVYLSISGEGFHRDMPIESFVGVSNADGTPSPDTTIEIFGSKDDEGKFKRLAYGVTNKSGVAKVTFRRPKFEEIDDDLDIKIVARSRAGKTGEATHDLSFYDDDLIKISTDRSIYKPGQNIAAVVTSTIKTATATVEVIKKGSTLASYKLAINNGEGKITIPYMSEMAGEIQFGVYIAESDDDDLITDAIGVIFPSPENLNVAAVPNQPVYKPGEEGSIAFLTTNEKGESVQSALGVVMFDKAVDERASDGGYFNSGGTKTASWLGYRNSFGGYNFKDINDLDLTKPITAEMYLAAEGILLWQRYYPEIYKTNPHLSNKQYVYRQFFGGQFLAVRDALNDAYFRNDYEIAKDRNHLAEILLRKNIKIDSLLDPWGQHYREKFYFEREEEIVAFETSGADKIFGTDDDLIADTIGFNYFTGTGKKITRAIAEHHMRTNEYVNDENTLLSELDVDNLLDKFGNGYKFEFSAVGRTKYITVKSLGKDGKEDAGYYQRDDFEVWRTSIDTFSETDDKIREILDEAKEIPKDAGAFTWLLKANGIDLEKLKAGNDESLFVTERKYSIYSDRSTVVIEPIEGSDKRRQFTKIEPVTRRLVEFKISSVGNDKKPKTYDDSTLADYSFVVEEVTRDGTIEPLTEKFQETKYPTGRIVVGQYGGVIKGLVTDASGAVCPGVLVTLKNTGTDEETAIFTDELGQYSFIGLNEGNYSVRADLAGFNSVVVNSIMAEKDKQIRTDIVLQIGTVSEVVNVSSESSGVVDTADAQIQTSVTSEQIVDLPKEANDLLGLAKLQPGISAMSGQNSTPRLREYFPETLMWQPEVITDSTGKAQVRFKMADNITSWKLYTIASTKTGKVGVSSKEVISFQSFFADLDPPKFITLGDEIYLPTQIRNYTQSDQSVDVKMNRGEWFDFLECENCSSEKVQKVNVAAGGSENAIFGFRATRSVKDGKQRVTALAQKESDAIEKPVTVRPDGEEIVKTDSAFAIGKTVHKMGVPANSILDSHRAELKIYPDLIGNVVESIDGILQRPYGCGEQTISSTYPNLMIVRLESKGVKLNPALLKQAKRNLKAGVDRLLGYQTSGGGFGYWGGRESADLALTAYALRFLADASQFIEIDEDVSNDAEKWLLSQQRADGTWSHRLPWQTSENAGQTYMTTFYVARSLAMLKPEDGSPANAAVKRAMSHLKPRSEQGFEPYIMALYGLAASDIGGDAEAENMIDRLIPLAKEQTGGSFWNLETNTPFYGWGHAGQIETTALVYQLMSRGKDQNKTALSRERAMLFLLMNKDEYGVWFSTQTTINVLDAILAGLDTAKPQPKTISVTIDGKPVKQFELKPGQIEQLSLDLTAYVATSAKNVEVKGRDGTPIMSRLVTRHYVDWKDSESAPKRQNDSTTIKLDHTCDKTTAAIMEEITCSVAAERVGYRGYGMLLAEIGIPPGADVDRQSLDAAKDGGNGISSYEILPDRIVVYMWARPGGTNFSFKFKPRYGIKAKTPASVVYDYYNPESRAVVEPLKFEVK